MNNLAGLNVQVNSFLTGSREAVQVGGVVMVSPAMFELMTNADPQELEHLCRNLMVRNLDPPMPDPEATALRMMASYKAAGVDVPKMYRDWGLQWPPEPVASPSEEG